MSKLISFVIPTYNRAEIIGRAVESIIAQSESGWELILIDDGSTDNTKQYIQRYLSDERISYHRQVHSGVSVARNSGLKLAKGDYVIFLDSDDYVYPDLIHHLRKVNFYNFDIICWQIHKVKDGKVSLWKAKRLEKIYNNITATFLAGSICYRKNILHEVGGFDPKVKFGENYELGIRISNLDNLKIKVLNMPLARYIINSDKRQSDSVANRILSNNYVWNKHKDLYKKDRLSNARFHYLMGFLHEKKSAKAEALRYYRQALTINPVYFKAIIKYLYLSF